MKKYAFIASVCGLAAVGLLLVRCGGSDSAAGLTVTGQASSGFAPAVTALKEKSSLEDGFAWLSRTLIAEAWALNGLSPIASAHVNVCTVDANGNYAPLAGHPTVLASSSGNFAVSITYNDAIKNNNQLFVCATDMTGSLMVLRPIPVGDLPTDGSQVTTVSLNPDLNGTVIAMFQCSQKVLFYNKSLCNKMEATNITSLDGAITEFFNGNQSMAGVDPNNLNSFLTSLFNDPTAGPVIQGYCAQVNGLNNTDCLASAKVRIFTKIPPPLNAGANSFDGSYAGGYGGSCPQPAGNVSGNFTMDIAGGAITGDSGGGALTGSVDGSGTANVGGSVQGSGCTFSGTFTATTVGVTAGGSWSCANGCAGSWSF